jgi:hypothetical protein
MKTFLAGHVISRIELVFLALALAVFGSGCLQTNMTDPPRSAMEQLLLSTATDRAMAQVDFSALARKRVFVDTNYFESFDSAYALGTIRDALSKSGALLVRNVTNCDLIVEPRSGALSIDRADSLIGLPHTAVPIPLAGSVPIPEVALFKSQKQYSTAKIALLVYSNSTGDHILSSGSLVGAAQTKYYKLLGVISYTSTDVPEKSRKKHPTFDATEDKQ